MSGANPRFCVHIPNPSPPVVATPVKWRARYVLMQAWAVQALGGGGGTFHPATWASSQEVGKGRRMGHDRHRTMRQEN
jgi:hypothetical protein